MIRTNSTKKLPIPTTSKILNKRKNQFYTDEIRELHSETNKLEDEEEWRRQRATIDQKPAGDDKGSG
jgi:hypothetical protein